MKNKSIRRVLITLILTMLTLGYLQNITLGVSAQSITELPLTPHKQKFYVDLDGEWTFFHEQLLTPAEIRNDVALSGGIKVHLPDSFEKQTNLKNTYGTYATYLTIPDQYINQPLALAIAYQYSAYKLFVEDEIVAVNGFVGNSKQNHQAEMSPRVALFTPTSNQVLITIQASSFEHIRGGLENSIFLGSAAHVLKTFNTQMTTTMFLMGTIFIMGLFLILFSFYRKQSAVNLIFGAFCVAIAARELFAEPFYYSLIYPNLSWVWGTRLEYILTELASALFVLLLWVWHQDVFSKWVMRFLVGVILSLMIITLFTQPVFFQALFFKVFYLAFPTILYVLYIIYRSIRLQKPYGKITVLGVLLISIAFINDYALGQNWLQSFDLMLLAVAVYVLVHLLSLSRQFARSAIDQENLNEELAFLNASLDDLVIERTMQLEQANKMLEQLAIKDDLTQIYNRNYFNGYIEEVFKSALENQSEATLFMIDVDHFKRYNDHYGHVQGDALLKKIAAQLKKDMPETCTLARYGGEEFAVVVTDISDQEAYDLAETMRQNIEAKKYPHHTSELGYITISIGIATMRKNTQFKFVNQWISAADRQLYESKFAGRNRVSQDDFGIEN